MPTNPELCPILALLAVSPHPLTPADVALVMREEEGVIRLALALLHESGHLSRQLSRRADKVVSLWSMRATSGNCREATSAFYRLMRLKRIDELARVTVKTEDQAAASGSAQPAS